jgi:hypothetical protein
VRVKWRKLVKLFKNQSRNSSGMTSGYEVVGTLQEFGGRSSGFSSTASASTSLTFFEYSGSQRKR